MSDDTFVFGALNNPAPIGAVFFEALEVNASPGIEGLRNPLTSFGSLFLPGFPEVFRRGSRP